MINTFPPTDKEYTYLQVNRGDDIGSIWSSMNLDLQSNLGQLRLAPRLILMVDYLRQMMMGCTQKAHTQGRGVKSQLHLLLVYYSILENLTVCIYHKVVIRLNLFQMLMCTPLLVITQ